MIGKPYHRVGGREIPTTRMTVIGRRCQIGDFVTIMRGSHLGEDVTVHDHCIVEQDVDIGRGSTSCTMQWYATTQLSAPGALSEGSSGKGPGWGTTPGSLEA